MTLEYIGRVVVNLLADDGSPSAAYAVMVRSPPNKARKFYDRGDRLYMGPLVEGSEPTVQNAGLIFYNTMLQKGNALFVTNGQQTDGRTYNGKRPEISFEDTFFPTAEPITTSEEIMQQWGYEQDSMKTPRVTLARFPNIGLFSIASEYNGETRADAIVHQPGFTPRGLSTYEIVDGQAVARHIANSGEIQKCLVEIPIGGNSPEELADSLFHAMHPDLVVASAAAVFRNGKWQVAFRNRFGTPEDLEAYKAERGLQ